MSNYPDVITGMEQADDEKTPISILIDFYRAFNRQDIQLMQDNWLQTPDASMSNPLGGVKRGWEQIRPVYEHIFNGPAKVYVEYYDFTIQTTDDMFCAVRRERGNLIKGETEVQLAIRTSRIYKQINGSWKQLHHHGSIDNPALLQHYQTAVLN